MKKADMLLMGNQPTRRGPFTSRLLLCRIRKHTPMGRLISHQKHYRPLLVFAGFCAVLKMVIGNSYYRHLYKILKGGLPFDLSHKTVLNS